MPTAVAEPVESPPPAVPAVERLLREAAARPGLIGFAGGLPAQKHFPRRSLVAAFLRALAEPEASALQYSWPEGDPGLRAWIAGRLRVRGADVTADDVIVTSGAQQAIALAIDLCCRPGDRVAVEPETYSAALQLFGGRGLVASPLLEGARAAYVMPAVSNPHGTALDEAARTRLLASRVPIVEDDAYADLRFAGEPPPPLVARDRTRTFHVGTFSKTLCPGLRVGWLVPPRRLRQRALRRKSDSDLQANGLAQAILAGHLSRDDFDARVRRLRRYYTCKAVRVGEALARRLPAWRFRLPEGGFSIWVETGDARDETAFLERAIAHGVSFDPGSMFRADGGRHPLALRLSFSAVEEADVEAGIQRLARAWHRPAVPRRARRAVGGVRR